MTLHEDLRLLDPVDREEPTPVDETLLHSILAAPVPRHPARARRPRLKLAAAAGVVAGAAVIVVPRGSGGDVLAAAFRATHQPGTILHYTEVVRSPGEAPGAGLETEVWQAADSSRQRVLTRAPGLGVHEEVVDGRGSRTYLGDSNQIIVYEEKAPRPDAVGGIGAPGMGDPRTLLERAQDPDTTVDALGEAHVRGVDVLQFRVGVCRVHVDTRSAGAVAMTYKSPLVVSIAKDDSMPVRVEQPACRATPDDGGPTTDVPAGPTVDYLGLEVLPASDKLLEMAPHPGAALVDGEDVDAAEERADRDMPTTVPEDALSRQQTRRRDFTPAFGSG
jgi:hypothetical protein